MAVSRIVIIAQRIAALEEDHALKRRAVEAREAAYDEARAALDLATDELAATDYALDEARAEMRAAVGPADEIELIAIPTQAPAAKQPAAAAPAPKPAKAKKAGRK